MADPNVIAGFQTAIRRKKAPPAIAKALFAAGIVESGLRNLNYGDRDSVGALQQRPSQGWKGLTNPTRAAEEFIDAAKGAYRKGMSSAQLAQAVQRSAFPGRYAAKDVQGQAQSYLRGAGATGGGGGTTAGGGSTSITVPGATVGGIPGGGTQALALLQALSKQQRSAPSSAGVAAPAFSAQAVLPSAYKPVSGGGGGAASPGMDIGTLLSTIGSDTSTPASSQDPSLTVQSPDAGSANTGPASAGLAKGKSPLFELIHKGDKPYAVKNGQVVDKSVYSSVWDNHAGHVHVAAGPNTIVGLGKLAQKMGLSVGSNPYFTGHPETSGHVSDSYHYRTGRTKSGKVAGEAIDVSGDPRKMNAYAARVEALYGLGR